METEELEMWYHSCVITYREAIGILTEVVGSDTIQRVLKEVDAVQKIYA